MNLSPSLLSLLLSISTIPLTAESDKPLRQAKGKPNVLFIAVDDLRTELGCYGESHIISPNIDRLAESGTRFERAYCMVPTCGASRASLFSGRRPTHDRFVRYTTRIDEDDPGFTALHQHFKNNGYHTVSLGKLLHYPADLEDGWSEPPWRPDRTEPNDAQPIPGWRPPANLEELTRLSRNKRLPFASFSAPDDALADGKIADEAIRQLEALSKGDKPFFLAVGFFKPHLPFNAPKKYWDLYDNTPIELPANYYPPENAPDEAIHNFGELRNYAAVPRNGPVSDQMARTLIRGYYACVSYTDAQIGKILETLDSEGLSDNTIVALWGDHGWNLGEHTLWCKHCTFENAMRAPLIIRSPGQSPSTKGKPTRALAEFIDIYPTLCDLAGLDQPDHLDGQSLAPTISDPAKPGKGYAIGRFRNGDTIRTDRWRYTEYTSSEDAGSGPIVARMLYDHDRDPEENRNLANLPEYKSIIATLSRQLNQYKGR